MSKATERQSPMALDLGAKARNLDREFPLSLAHGLQPASKSPFLEEFTWQHLRK
jgi:hypothetical protein